jgi:Tfp pilus assembly protein PilO
MAVLKHHLQSLFFQWQQGPFGHRWVTAMLAMVLILAALVGHAFFTSQQLQQAVQQLPARSTLAMTATKTAVPTATQSLQQWPSEDEAERISAEILAQADAMGMIFERAEFQSIPIEHSTLQIQRIKLPLKGDYPQVRQFLSRVLQGYPSLAVSQFKLQRSDVMQTGVEAYVEFSLYTRKREPT